jgi:hypothetical protein
LRQMDIFIREVKDYTHMPIHLMYEEKFRGFIQYRWIYLFERLGITYIISNCQLFYIYIYI